MTEKHPNLKPPWEKGCKSPNPNGRPKGSGITDRLRRILEEDDGKVSEALAKSIIKSALKGDHKFVNTILERIEGKVTDKLHLDGEIKTVVQRFTIAEPPKADDEE